jgi:tripartite-type tricarboxylate transporter receptor subunit TctC
MKVNEVLRTAGALLVLGLALAGPSRAQAQALKGPVKLVVGYPAGGTADAIARMLADKLKDDLGVPVLVENRTGAGGQIAAEAVKAAPADGLTLLVANTHMMVMSPLTYKTVRYDPVRDFKAVGRVSSFYEGVAVARDVKADTVAQWLEAARADSKSASFGVPAAGSLSQFIGFRLGTEARATLLPVPYRGSVPLVQDLLGQQISAGITPLGDLAQHQATGRLRVIAVNGARRSSLLPDVPTLKELGFAHFDTLEWVGLFAPAATARTIIDQYQPALAKALGSKDIQDKLQKLGMEADPGSPETLERLLADELARWAPVIKASGFMAE